MISVVLVVLVVFLFLRNVRATLDSGGGGSGLADRNLRGDVSLRLFAGQSVADGAGDCERIRGGRCDRGDGEHHRGIWRRE